jgi:Bcr/CflA subfamily drug resistance transporter
MRISEEKVVITPETTTDILVRMSLVIVRDEKTTYELPIRKLELIIITGAISAFASLSIDTYLPALPSLEHFFSATSTQVQLTLASFFVAFAMGQVAYGPIIDRFGRKRPLCAALLLYATASAGCALSGSIGTLVMMRFVQALGACAGGVIARAIVRDCFDAHETARIFSLLILVTGLSPMLAPILGGYVFVLFGWRAIFWLLSLIGMIFFAGVLFRLLKRFTSTLTPRSSYGKSSQAMVVCWSILTIWATRLPARSAWPECSLILPDHRSSLSNCSTSCLVTSAGFLA